MNRTRHLLAGGVGREEGEELGAGVQGPSCREHRGATAAQATDQVDLEEMF